MALLWTIPAVVLQAAPQDVELALDAAGASHFAKLVLKCVRQEYPNKLDHVMNGAAEVQSPKVLHPAFYGCFDWHSSVHGHWMLVKVLRDFPNLPEAKEIRAVLEEHLSPARIATEVAYFTQPNRKSFERTYGWAWLLKLAAELRAWDAPEGRRWSTHLQPLANRVTEAFLDFLPRQTYPIRTGVHPNTAFSLSLVLDYARSAKDSRLETLICERSRSYFGVDRNGPIAWEPGGEDFLSACLEESALMAKVLPKSEFRTWVTAFLPALLKDGLLVPAKVSDRTDPKIVHLDGLNLSRARCLYAITAVLGSKDARREALLRTADVHARASLPFIASGGYEGEHWLGSFAVHMLDARRVVRN
jgi:hypothetical protein